MNIPFAKTAGAVPNRRAPNPLHVASKLIAAVAGSSSLLMRIAAHPIGASICLALGYMVLCGLYIILSDQIAARAAWSVGELHNLERLKGLAFVLVTGAAYFLIASRMLKRIASQQQ